MKKQFTRILSLVLALILTCSCAVVASAESDASNAGKITPYFVTISSTSANLDVSLFTATCTASISAKKSTSLSILIALQKLKSGSYETVQSWLRTGSGTQLSLEKTYTANVFATYRMKVTFTAGSETTTVYRYE